jgi:hypothetical protein
MNKKKLLSRLVYLTAIIGLIFAAVPFVNSLNPGEKAKNDAWVKCDLSELQEGEIMQCGLAEVYKRTEIDKLSVSKYASFLEDRESKNSGQPEDLKNEWRSSDKNYFVYRPWAPIRGCKIEFMKAGLLQNWEPPEAVAMKNLPYYFERCEGRAWDMSGRLYHREGYPPEKNLIVPKTKWVSESLMFIYHGK